MTSKAEYEACYRFVDNGKVTPAKILQPHIEATYNRIQQIECVLIVQDTTELDLTRPEQQVQGAGPMDSKSRRGAFYHPQVAFDPRGVALGTVGEQSWTRDEITKAPKEEKNKKRKKLPIEEKESYRWIEGLELAQAIAQSCPETMCVCMGESEADIYELFAAHAGCQTTNLHLLVRGGQSRKTTEKQDWVDLVRGLPKGRRANRQCPSAYSQSGNGQVSSQSLSRSPNCRTSDP